MVWYLMKRKKNVVKQSVKRGPGRPITRQISIHATAEEIAKAMFAAAKPPDPSKRIKTKRD